MVVDGETHAIVRRQIQAADTQPFPEIHLDISSIHPDRLAERLYCERREIGSAIANHRIGKLPALCILMRIGDMAGQSGCQQP